MLKNYKLWNAKINVFGRSITITKAEQKKIMICYIFQEI